MREGSTFTAGSDGAKMRLQHDVLADDAAQHAVDLSHEDQVRDLARTILARYGYHIIEASLAPEARQVAAAYQGRIHLLLTDLVMPGEGGTDLARDLSASRPDMRVLYMSGYTDRSVVKHGHIGPDTPFLHKAFTAAGLQSKVREVLS
jgi:DNA-binding NtrC family response regulator